MLHSLLKYITLLLTLFWFLLCTYLSHQPGEATAATSLHLAELLGNTGFFEVGELNGILRKAAHVVTFAVLAFLSSLTVIAWEIDKRYVWTLLIWSLIDEVTKVFVQGRHCSMFEIGLNMIGVVVGVLVGWTV